MAERVKGGDGGCGPWVGGVAGPGSEAGARSVGSVERGLRGLPLGPGLLTVFCAVPGR